MGTLLSACSPGQDAAFCALGSLPGMPWLCAPPSEGGRPSGYQTTGGEAAPKSFGVGPPYVPVPDMQTWVLLGEVHPSRPGERVRRGCALPASVIGRLSGQHLLLPPETATWGQVEAATRAWLEGAEERALRGMILAISDEDDDDEEEEEDGVLVPRWRMVREYPGVADWPIDFERREDRFVMARGTYALTMRLYNVSSLRAGPGGS